MKELVYTLISGVTFFGITYLLNMKNPNWKEIAITTVVYMVIFYVLSIIYKKKKDK